MAFESSAWLRRIGNVKSGRNVVTAWRRFSRDVRTQGISLLSDLDRYPDSILVAGCQRSGTTMLARLLTDSDGMVTYSFGVDDELDAALMLSGRVAKPAEGRYCFQTTYLNEAFHEYAEHIDSFRLIWVIRNPFSVVHSFLYNWSGFALNELFEGCGVTHLGPSALKRYRRFGSLGVTKVEKACAAYAGKTAQIFHLSGELPTERLLVIEYDKLVREKSVQLPKIYDFVELDYRSAYADAIHSKSLKKRAELADNIVNLVEAQCVPVYKKAIEDFNL